MVDTLLPDDKSAMGLHYVPKKIHFGDTNGRCVYKIIQMNPLDDRIGNKIPKDSVGDQCG